MRAISCIAPGQLALIEVDRTSLRPGWVRVAIRHIGICGTDYHIFEGTHPFLEYPRIMGHELSGVVSELPNRGTSYYHFEFSLNNVQTRETIPLAYEVRVGR